MSSNTRSRRFDPIVKVADHREQKAAREFGRLQDDCERHELRLEELERWWQEYADGLSGNATVNTGLIREGRLFLARLNDAVSHQRVVVESARREVEAARAKWLTLRMDREALEKAVGRFQEEENLQTRRSEQREQDDCALRGKHTPQS